MGSDRQAQMSRTRADIWNDVTLAERHMANEAVAPHAVARRQRDAEIIKGRQEVISCRWRVGSCYGFRVGHGRLLSTLWLAAGLRPHSPVSRRRLGASRRGGLECFAGATRCEAHPAQGTISNAKALRPAEGVTPSH